MYRGVIFIIVICSVNGFNIRTSPVENFTNDDPLFGQTIINTTDGVLVPSPTSGKLFKCALKNDCVLIHSHGETPKGLKHIASVAANVISEDEHLLVCNQILTRNRSTEYLNGNCTMINVAGTVKLNPYELVMNLNATHNSKNEGVKERRKRDAQGSTHTKADEDEDEDEDAWTEIAFVLDGSGSIQPDDFQKAKDFIFNVMHNVWKTCFDCNFAIVQYGSEIRTELSLLDNKDSARALEKVKEIEQIKKVTKTASAIHHVLTNIFVPENGSKNNSRKMMIVLSDGEILGDQMNLSDVLNMKQMEGVTRFAIGVGDGLKPEAVEEMKEIGNGNNFFHVSNYAALQNILSQLAQSIIGIEGTGGFQFQLAEAGFSSHIMHDRSLLFGAVGAFDWSGGLIVKSDETVKFFNASKNGPKFSYLGYSVTSARLPSKTLYISGAPRYNLTGGVFIFEGSEKYVLQGEQVGSYYGSVICALDIDMNGYTDYLLVGAPHFHQFGEEGKVLVYRLNQQERFDSVDMELQGDAGQTFARFGAAIASLGDIDGNKHSDVAVGAPLETDASGSIYIYNGFKDALRFSQKISPSDFGWKLVNFGQSVSSIPSTPQIKPWIAVGSQGKVAAFETIPVMIIRPTIKIEPQTIPLSQQKQTMSSPFDKFNVCFNIKQGKLQHERLSILYQIDLDFGQNKKRLSVGGESLLKTDFTLESHTECTGHISLNYLGCDDCFSPIQIKLNFSLAPNSIGAPIRILDVFSQTEISEEISFEKECLNPEVCKPKMTLSNSEISESLIIIGETESLNIDFHLTNTEELSYMTTLTLTYPNILNLKKTEGHCPVRMDGLIECLPLYPKVVFRKGDKTNFSISWQLNDTKSELHQFHSEIIANLTSKNQGTQVLDTKIYKFDVKYSLPIQLTGIATPKRFRIEGGKTETSKLQVVFEFVGENKYGATINVVVNITKDTFNTEVIIDNVKPKECLVPTNKIVEASYLISCSMKKLQKIIIDASVSIRDVQDKSDRIIAVAQYTFNNTIYAAKNTLRTVPVEVIITKLAVTSSKGPIIGGSIGGLLLLIIILIILIKCGFFRRRRKMEQAQSTN